MVGIQRTAAEMPGQTQAPASPAGVLMAFMKEEGVNDLQPMKARTAGDGESAKKYLDEAIEVS